jgi:hypothetical protein
MTDQASLIAAIRHDGWTPERRTQFLDHLAHAGSVCAACARVGLSREAAYRLRRRDALFARGWDAALVLARAASAEVLACRALDGVEEEIWYRGELVGTRRRYDSRLLLAHIARLDRIAEGERARQDAARFDELLALVGGEMPPEDLVDEDDELPLTRDEIMGIAADMAEDDWREEAATLPPVHDESSEEARWRLSTMRWQVSNEAVASAGARWDEWFAKACATVDRLLGEPAVADPAIACTLSGLSTSPAAEGEPEGPKRAVGP